MTQSHLTLSQVIGRNVQRLRGDHTLEEVATQGRRFGARWSGGSVRAIEQGEFKETLETIALLALALDGLDPERKTIGDGKITVWDLLQTDQSIILGTKVRTTVERLLDFLGGAPSGSLYDGRQVLAGLEEGLRELTEKVESLNLPNQTLQLLEDIEDAGPESATEHRLAKKIGVDVLELRAWSVYLWGKSFESHRDQEAGPGATPQKKGRLSRDLLSEIQQAMKENASGDR